MQKWEYKRIRVGEGGPFNADKPIVDEVWEEVNEAGLEGWEMVNIIPIPSTGGVAHVFLVVFKRPIE